VSSGGDIDRRLATEFEIRLPPDYDLRRLARRAELVLAEESEFEAGPAERVSSWVARLIVIITLCAIVLMVALFGGSNRALMNINAKNELNIFLVSDDYVGTSTLGEEINVASGPGNGSGPDAGGSDINCFRERRNGG